MVLKTTIPPRIASSSKLGSKTVLRISEAISNSNPNNNQHFNKPSRPGNDRYDKDKRPDNRRDRDHDRDRKDKDRKEKDKKEKDNKRQESKRSEVYRRS